MEMNHFSEVDFFKNGHHFYRLLPIKYDEDRCGIPKPSSAGSI